MESRAGRIDKKLTDERNEFKLIQRKKNIENILKSKRLPPSPPKAQIEPQPQFVPEVKEDSRKEETGEAKGHLDLSKYRKKRLRKSKKKCWICKSEAHFKRNCDQIRCFYCKEKGHMKRDCMKKKTNLIFNCLSEIYGKYMQAYKKKHKKIQDYLEKIYTTKYQKEGNTYKVIWQNQQVGEYTGPGKPTPFEKLEHESINLKFIDSSLKRGTPFEKLKLFDGLANTCACGESGLKKGAFIKHIKEYHNGIALPVSQTNQPPWYDWIFFYSDAAEEIFTSINIS